jgi:hypothetical protein
LISTLHTPSTVAAVLFEDPGSRQLQPQRKFLMECFGGAIQMGVGAPAKMSRAVKHLFRAHLEDYTRMRTDPNAVTCDVTQHRIKHCPVSPGKKWVDPDQHSIACEKLGANLIHYIIGIERGFWFNAKRGQGLENAIKSILPWRCRVPLGDVPGPQQRQLHGTFYHRLSSASLGQGNRAIVMRCGERDSSACRLVGRSQSP